MSSNKKECKTAKSSGNQTIVKVLQILSYLAESKSPVRLQDIAEDNGMSQATVLRYLQTLLSEGYIYQDSRSKMYSMTWKITELGSLVRDHVSLRTLSNDVVMKLSEELSLGICLVIEHDMECMYLDCIYEPREMGFSVMRIGKQTPLNAASSGKIILSQYTDDMLDELIRSKGLIKLTDNTITTKTQLARELKKVREQGYAVDDEECEEGLRCIAAPIFGYDGRIIAAVSAFGSIDKLTVSHMTEDVLPILRESAAEITFRTGGDPGASL